MTLQCGEMILMQVLTMKLGKDGNTYVTISNPEVFANNATLILKKPVVK